LFDDGDNALNGFVFMLATAITTYLDFLYKNKKAEKMQIIMHLETG